MPQMYDTRQSTGHKAGKLGNKLKEVNVEKKTQQAEREGKVQARTQMAGTGECRRKVSLPCQHFQ